MMKKILTALALILILTTANALTITEPKHKTVTEITATEGKTASLPITIANNTQNTIQNITLQTSLENAEFSHNGFGLDPGKTKTVNLLVTPERSDKADVLVKAEGHEQRFVLQVNTLPNPQGIQAITSLLKGEEALSANTVLLLIVALVLAITVSGTAIIMKNSKGPSGTSLAAMTMIFIIIFLVYMVSSA